MEARGRLKVGQPRCLQVGFEWSAGKSRLVAEQRAGQQPSCIARHAGELLANRLARSPDRAVGAGSPRCRADPPYGQASCESLLAQSLSGRRALRRYGRAPHLGSRTVGRRFDAFGPGRLDLRSASRPCEAHNRGVPERSAPDVGHDRHIPAGTAARRKVARDRIQLRPVHAADQRAGDEAAHHQHCQRAAIPTQHEHARHQQRASPYARQPQTAQASVTRLGDQLGGTHTGEQAHRAPRHRRERGPGDEP